MGNAILKKEDYILFILNHLEPDKSDLFYLNKLAFLVEFAYLFFNKEERHLSDAEYAAIKYGPVIDGYADILKDMESKGLLKITGKDIRLISTKEIEVPEDVSTLAIPLIKKYSALSFEELKAITHETDSYKITTENEKVITGNVIDKNLAALETFFDDSIRAGDQIPDEELPTFNREDLVKYEFGPIVRG